MIRYCPPADAEAMAAVLHPDKLKGVRTIFNSQSNLIAAGIFEMNTRYVHLFDQFVPDAVLQRLI